MIRSRQRDAALVRAAIAAGVLVVPFDTGLALNDLLAFVEQLHKFGTTEEHNGISEGLGDLPPLHGSR